MENIDKILAYSDNGLTDAQESQFFNELAADKTMRETFKNHIRIKNTAGRMGQEFLPSAGTTTGLFAALGLDYTGPETTASGSSNISGDKNAGLLPTFYEGGIAALLALIVLSGVLFLSDEPRSLDSSEMQDTDQMAENIVFDQTVIDNPVLKSNTESANYPVSSSRNIDTKPNTLMNNRLSDLRIQLSELEKENALLKQRLEILDSDRSAEDISGDMSDATRKYIEPSTKYVTLWEENSSVSGRGPEIQLIANDPYSVWNDGWNQEGVDDSEGLLGLTWLNTVGLEYKNYHYWNVGQENLSPKDPPAFNNEGLTLVITVLDHTDILLDARRENFNLQFMGSEDGREYRYETYPNLETFSLGLRQKFEISDKLELYGQASYGLNNIGGVYRGGGGFKFSPFRNMSLVTGWEYSYMGFDFQGKAFDSQKNGMYYGIMLNL